MDNSSFIDMRRYRVNKETGEKVRDLFWEQMNAGSRDTNAMVRLGVAFQTGDGIEKDVEIATAWYEWAANHGDSWGMFNLSINYAHGVGIERSFERDLYWLERAAEENEEGAEQSLEVIKKLISDREAAVTGDPKAMGKYAGTLMAHGNMVNEGFEIDYKESSKIINILTKEYGVIGLIARGTKQVKSKLAGVTSKLTYGCFHLNYRENGLSNLIEVDVIDRFKNIRKDIDLMSYSLYLLELAAKVYKHDDNNLIYDMLIDRKSVV